MICVECDQRIDPYEHAHAAHEPGCAVDPRLEDWSCRCDAHAHVRCCRACAPVVEVSGQLDLLGVKAPRPVVDVGLPEDAA